MATNRGTRKIKIGLLALCFLSCCVGALGLFLPQMKVITNTDIIIVKGYEIVLGVEKIDGGNTGFSIWGLGQYLFLAIGMLYVALFLLDELFGISFPYMEKHRVFFSFFGVVILFLSIIFGLQAIKEIKTQMIWTGPLLSMEERWEVEDNLFTISMIAQYASYLFILIYSVFVYSNWYYTRKWQK